MNWTSSRADVWLSTFWRRGLLSPPPPALSNARTDIFLGVLFAFIWREQEFSSYKVVFPAEIYSVTFRMRRFNLAFPLLHEYVIVLFICMRGCRFYFKRPLCRRWRRRRPVCEGCVLVSDENLQLSTGAATQIEPLHLLLFYTPLPLQGGWARRGQPHDHPERGHRVWTHAAAARNGNGEHRRPHGLPEPDRGADPAGVRQRFWEVEEEEAASSSSPLTEHWTASREALHFRSW